MSSCDDSDPCRFSTTTENDHAEKVHDIIRKNRRLTIRDVADEMDISVGSCHLIFSDKI